jgi:hypothetical protein
MLVVPFRVFGFAARHQVLPAQGRPLRIGYSFRVSCSLSCRPYSLDDPTLPLAVPSAVWFVLNEVRWSLFSVQSSPLFEFRLRSRVLPSKT